MTRAGCGAPGLQLLQRHGGHVRERGALDEERVRDAARHARRCSARRSRVLAGAGVRGDADDRPGSRRLRPGAIVICCGTSISTPFVCGLRRDRHRPGPGTVARVARQHQHRLDLGAVGHVDSRERERLGRGEDLRVVGGGDVRQARRLRAGPTPPACVRYRPRPADAVDISADLTCHGDQSGWRSSSTRLRLRRAASPSTCLRRPRSWSRSCAAASTRGRRDPAPRCRA